MDIQTILKNTPYATGWRPVGEPTEETKQVQNPITGVTQTVGTGEYTLVVTDGKITRPIKLKQLSPAVPGHPAGAGTTDADAAFSSGSAADWALISAGADLPSPSGKEEEHQIIEIAGRKVDYYPKRPAGQQYVDLGPAGAPTKQTTPADKLEQIKDPNTGKVIKLRDPATGTVIDLPDTASASKPSLQMINGSAYSWDGSKLTLQQAGPAADVKPKENDTRPNVAGGYQVREIFKGGAWVTDPSFTPIAYDPSLAGKAKDGDTRPNTDNKGQKIQEIFKGGSWVTDTSVAPTPFGTQAPTTLNTGEGPYIVQQDPTTGQTTNIPNPNTTDITARVQQLQATARAKSEALKAQVASGAKSAEAAAAEFDEFWSTTIDPQSQQLAQAQQRDTFDVQTKANQEARLEEATRASSLTSAQAAGQNAVKNYNDLGAGVERVGPGYGAALGNVLGAFSSGKAPGPIDGGSLTWQAPDMNAMAEKATAEALAHISPTAAGIAGRPMPQIPQGLDVAGALQKSSYQPSTTIAPDGTVTITHAPAPAPQPPPFQGLNAAQAWQPQQPGFSGLNAAQAWQPPRYEPAVAPF